MQQSFSTDPTLGERLFDLLDTVFPGLRQVADNARALARIIHERRENGRKRYKITRCEP